jgi:hypothetical protein
MRERQRLKVSEEARRRARAALPLHNKAKVWWKLLGNVDAHKADGHEPAPESGGRPPPKGARTTRVRDESTRWHPTLLVLEVTPQDELRPDVVG